MLDEKETETRVVMNIERTEREWRVGDILGRVEKIVNDEDMLEELYRLTGYTNGKTGTKREEW